MLNSLPDPRSEAGRAAVAQNRVTHGLTGSFRVLGDECQADFDELLAALMHEHAPADVTETEFVQQMAEALWLSRRSVRLQDACIVALQSGDRPAEESARKNLALYCAIRSPMTVPSSAFPPSFASEEMNGAESSVALNRRKRARSCKQEGRRLKTARKNSTNSPFCSKKRKSRVLACVSQPEKSPMCALATS